MNFKHALWILFTVFILVACNSVGKNGEKGVPDKVEVIAPTNKNKGRINGSFKGCGFDKEQNPKSISISLPGNRELNQINSILKFSGLSSNFIVFSAPIGNALATIIDGKRYILYDPLLLQYTDISSGSYWSSMSILAHEIGHHLSGHTITPSGSSISNELEADKFSGFVLYKLGASIEQASAAMQTLASETDSETHPAKYKRLAMIRQGWVDANNQKFTSAIPPPPEDDISYNTECGTTAFDAELLIGGSTITYDNGAVDDLNSDDLYMEGIIINISKLDRELANFYGFLENDYEYDYNLVLTIELSDITGKNAGNINLRPGKRAEFYALQTCYITNAYKSCFNDLIVPGRKISFKSYDFRRGLQRIYYVQKLNRDGSSVKTDFNPNELSITSPSTSGSFIVSTVRAYFHNTPNTSDRRNAYMVYGEQGTIIDQSSSFIYVEFVNPRGQKSRGWVLTSAVKLSQ